MVRKKPCVLACVTSQFECDRIIKTAEHIANEEECELRVLSVLQPTSDYSEIGGEIEYLYKVARESGADMVLETAKQESDVTVMMSLPGVSEPPRPDVSASHDKRNRTAIKLHTVVLRFILPKNQILL